MNKSRGDLSSLRIAITFSVCDSDEKHFGRFKAELARLGIPYAVNFDHCSKNTKRTFKESDLFINGYEDDAAASHFHEAHRQRALEIVQKRGGFDWVLQMDVDETLELNAPEKIKQVMALGADVVDCVLLDLWGDGLHYRKDGPFGSSHREKFFNLRTAQKLYYYHPTSHAPKHIPHDGRDAVVVKGYPLYFFHWGIMNINDANFHIKRWNAIYTKAVGNNPYQGFYDYIGDPVKNPPTILDVDPSLVVKEYLADN